MTRPFTATTAEQVIAVVAALATSSQPRPAAFVAAYVDTTDDVARKALTSAVELGFVSENAGVYEIRHPLARYARTADPSVRAAVLRLVLEEYGPYRFFRGRLLDGEEPEAAAKQTVAAEDLDASHAEVRDTLINLGTYCGSLGWVAAGRYAVTRNGLADHLHTLLKAASTDQAAEALARERLGAKAVSQCSYADVILPLVKGFVRAAQGDGDGAVLEAGNAVESYLAEYAARKAVGVSSDNGIHAKANRLKANGLLPSKLVGMAAYLGNLRNAADHGADPETGAAWRITANSGAEYVSVACSFVAACTAFEHGLGHTL